jgi:transcriptional regulator with XRE-family HTH domain
MSAVKRLAMRLRQLRMEQGLSQEELARRAKISRVYLNKLETLKQDPRLSVVARLAGALRVSVGKLVDSRRRTSERGRG